MGEVFKIWFEILTQIFICLSIRQSTDEVIDKDTASLTDSSVKDENYTWDIWIVTYSLYYE